MPLPAGDADGAPRVRRIKSKRDLGDVVMDLNDKKTVEGIPDEVMQVLTDMTLGGSDKLHLWEVEKCAAILERVKSACAPHSGGKPSYEQCNDGVDLLMRIMQAKNDNHPEMVYTHLPQQLQSVFKCWDLDGSGSVSATELHAAAGAWTKMHEEKTLLKRLLFGAVIVMLVLFVGIFVLGMVTSELSKEFKASSGTMVDNTGRSVRVASSGFDVSSDGTLQVLGPQGQSCTGEACARRLASDGGSALVSTQMVRNEKALHSALPDSFFDALDEISIHSEKGHKLNLKISGFARIPVLGSRCGNVVHLFSVVAGHLTLDSTDITFSGHLQSLFKNAGFELAVGGGETRRLRGVRVVTGFFNHVRDAKAAGWTCKGVPLPRTPKTYTWTRQVYTPCSKSSTCESQYGGWIPGVFPIPAQHLHAASTRLDGIRRKLGHDVDIHRVQYRTATMYVMRSPTYFVQVDSMPNHPKQERLYVVNEALEQGVSFQRMLGSFDRTFCKPTDMKNEPVTSVAHAEASGVNATLHFEFMGVESEGGAMYRHWRAMPTSSFRKWVLGDGAKDAEKYFEYWDDAQTLAPYRLLDDSGALTVFSQSSEGTTDADVEELLGPATDDALSAAAHRLSCAEDEADAFHPAHGTVPAMHGPVAEPTNKDLDFYVRLLAEELETCEDDDALGPAEASSGASADVDGDAEDDNSTSSDPEKALQDAWAAMRTTRASGTNCLSNLEHDFATYALRSLELFAMPDGCADACAKPLAAAMAAVEQLGDEALCGTRPTQALSECLSSLLPPLSGTCEQSPFRSVWVERCLGSGRLLHEEAGSKREAVTPEVLADGTHAFPLGALGAVARERLSAGLSEAVGDRLGDLSGARLLVNRSSHDVVLASAALNEFSQASTRLLKGSDNGGGKVSTGIISWCGSITTPLCFEIGFPLGCRGTCKFSIKVTIHMPDPRGRKDERGNFNPKYRHWAVEVDASGTIDLLKKLDIPNPPVYGEIGAGGNIYASLKPACGPNYGISFTLEGSVRVWAALGLDAVPGFLPKINMIKMEVKVGAKIAKIKPFYWEKDISPRRRYFGSWGYCERRRRSIWKKKFFRGSCEIVVYVKYTVTIVAVRGWILAEYLTSSKFWILTLGFDYFEVWMAFLATWQNFDSWNILRVKR